MEKTNIKHEMFQIDEVMRKKIVRQDRIQLPPETCFIQINSELFEIYNISPFGVALVCSNEKLKDFQKFNKDILNAKIIFDNFEIQDLKVRLARTDLNENKSIIGLEVLNEPVKIERVFALLKTKDTVSNVLRYATQLEVAPQDFKNLIYELRDILLRLKNEIDRIESGLSQDNRTSLAEFELTVADGISIFLNAAIPKFYQRIPSLLKNLSETQSQFCTEFAREQLGHLVYGAPFANRAYFKPRGYAGDYEMMNHLYREEAVGRTLFDKCMHKYFVDEPAGVAVKNRGTYLFNKIKKTISSKSGPVKILAVASGPALEQQLFIKNCPEFKNRDVEFTCIDQDEESLKHAQLQIMSLNRLYDTSYNFKFSNLAIKNIILKGLPGEKYDLIYTAGLFDYFTDPVAEAAAIKLFEGLAPGGELIIGNFSKDNPSTPFMELVLDWNLIYRSVDDLKKLFSNVAPIVEVEMEPLKINLFATMRK